MLYCEGNYESKSKLKSKILIVEDSEFVNKAIHTVLDAKEHYVVEQSFDFEQASEKLKESEYDFILLDLNLPDAYGEDLVNDVKGLSKAKIIILTAEADKQIRESLFKNGILDYIVKDENFSKSLDAIDDTIQAITKNSNTNILVIDDSMFMCKQIQKILDVRNHNSVIALTAKDGFEKLCSQKFNLIILDMELPDKHGLELLGEIKEKDEFFHIPVIVLSGNNDPEIVRDCLKSGASNFITKPFNIEEFTLKVDLAIESNRKNTEVLCKQKMLEEYKQAIDDSNIVSKTDSRGIITFANDKFCKISGYSKEELIGKPHNIVRHPDMPKKAFKDMWETIQSKKAWSGIVKNLKKDGSTYYVQATISPIVDYDGSIVEYIGIRTDITELEEYKVRLKNALEENESYTRQYEHGISAMIPIIKTDTNNKINFVNEAFSELSGYQLDDIKGLDCSQLRDEKHVKAGECQKIGEQVLKKETVKKVLTNVAKDKKRYIAETFFYPIVDKDKKVVEILQIMHDITNITKLNKEITETQKEIIYKMGEVGESRSKETGNHVKRVAEYSKLLAILSGLGLKSANLLFTASPMHDIGKVAIPDSILKKPGKLTDEEWNIMRTHSEIGYNILKGSSRPILKAAAIVAYRHHEKWDGSGYPNGIKGENIHIFARITALADVFDALGSNRSYKKAWELEKILNLFEEEKGKHFDPKLVELFLNNLDKFLLIRDKFKD